ncbi:response regulator [Fibrella aquatica]|jgi:CheY-like chemotaxis protein|uniref:response regulator n=1 Tax=Fibrella aquatica TaxID=3242487 RepID=UPI00352288BE
MKSDTTNTAISRQNFRRARVLLIQHDIDQQALIKRCFATYLPEVELVKAINEEQAITYLQACKFDEWKLPKMILLDALMPCRDDAWRILRRIKELPAPINQVPVVMLGYADDPEDISGAYDRGSSSYLVKPANVDEWPDYFQMLRKYWWETVLLPSSDYRY